MNAIYNNEIVNTLNLTFNDRALQFGDGLFETISVKREKVRFLEDHVARLLSGCNALGLDINLEVSQLQKDITNLIEINNISGDARAKLIVWRKASNKPGYSFDTREVNTLLKVSSAAYNSNPDIKGKAEVCNKTQLVHTSYSRFKTLNALPYIIAANEREERMLDELILTDQNGNISECISANIFWLNNGIIYTPSLESGCLEGVMRKQIIKAAGVLSLTVVEGLFQMDHIANSDAIFGSNVGGIFYINTLNDELYSTDNKIVKSISKIVNLS